MSYRLAGSAYSRAIRGHLFIYSALISLILDPYLKLLSDEDLKYLTDLEDPSNDVDSDKKDKVMTELRSWLTEEKKKTVQNPELVPSGFLTLLTYPLF